LHPAGRISGVGAILLLPAIGMLLLVAAAYAVATAANRQAGVRSWAIEGAVLVGVLLLAAAFLTAVVAS
jgi:hypothetical protein